MTLTEAAVMDGGPDFEIVLLPDLGALAPMRRELAARIGPGVVGSGTVDNLVLVVSELATNAIQATANGTPVLVRIRPRVAVVIAEVENHGPGFVEPARLAERAASGTEGGRGLLIVRALTNEMTVSASDGRCVVRAVVPVA